MEDSIAKSLLGHLNHRIKIKRLTTRRVVGNVEKGTASDTIGVVVVETGGTCRSPVMADGDHFVDLFGVDDVDEILCHCVPLVLGWISRLISTIVAKHVWYNDRKLGTNETFRDTLPHLGVIGPAMLKQQGGKRSVAFKRVVGVGVTPGGLASLLCENVHLKVLRDRRSQLEFASRALCDDIQSLERHEQQAALDIC